MFACNHLQCSCWIPPNVKYASKLNFAFSSLHIIVCCDSNQSQILLSIKFTDVTKLYNVRDFKHIARPYFQAQLIWDVSHARVRPRFMGLCSKDYCHTKNDSWLHLFTSLCLRAISKNTMGPGLSFSVVTFQFSCSCNFTRNFLKPKTMCIMWNELTPPSGFPSSLAYWM